MEDKKHVISCIFNYASKAKAHKLKALSTETSYVMTLIYRWLQYSGLDGGIWRQRTG